MESVITWWDLIRGQAWFAWVAPAVIFAVFGAVGWTLQTWLRRYVQKLPGVPEQGELYGIAVSALRAPILLWFLLLGLYWTVRFSSLPLDYQSALGRAVLGAFVISATFFATNIASRFVEFYVEEIPHLEPVSRQLLVATRSFLWLIAALYLISLLGVSIAPLVLGLGLVGVAALVALRDVLSSLFASFQIAITGHIKVGDRIRLDGEEAGTVEDITWRSATIRTPMGQILMVPNAKLAQSAIVRAMPERADYLLRVAGVPFRFYETASISELTGQEASMLRELVDILREAPDSVVYYHSLHFVQRHQYLLPEPPSDFAIWVRDALGDEELGEMLASVDTTQFVTMNALRERLVEIMDAQLAHNGDSRRAPPGREFHFMKSINYVFTTPYIAYNLRDFVRTLRKVSTSCIYFHLFEARFLLGHEDNDFSRWIIEGYGNEELAREIRQLDPYTRTLDGLRSAIIEMIESPKG